jgi:hypothetical protein
MGAHRIAVDMMDKASALPTYPQRQQQKQPTDFTIGLKASTRLHDEGEKGYPVAVDSKRGHFDKTFEDLIK